MIESTRESENRETVVLVHPLGRRLAATLPSTAIEVSSVLDAIGFVARGAREHHVTAVIVGGDQLRRFPDAATAIKRLDERVRVIEVEAPAAPGADGFPVLAEMTSDVDARLGDADAPSMVQAAVSGRLRGDHAPAAPPRSTATPVNVDDVRVAPAAPATSSPGSRPPDLEPRHPSDLVDAEERRALTASLLDDAESRTPGFAGWSGVITDDRFDASDDDAANRRMTPPMPPPPPPPPHSPEATSRTGDRPGEATIDAPPPLSFAEAVRAREEAFEPITHGGGSLGDIDLVEAVLSGEGRIGRIAVQLMREQTDWHDLEFLDRVVRDPGGDPDAEPEVESGGRLISGHVTVAPVEDDGRRFGVLRSRIAGEHELHLWAGWLSRWLELGRRHDLYRTQSRTDELTGALNRRGMFEFLDDVLASARDRRRPVTVMAFDIDDFKRFNDRFGHGAGDIILQETVALLRSVTRRTDRVCRVGGDEFAVVFSDPEGPRVAGSAMPHDVEVIARRFQEQVQRMRFPKLGIDAPGQVSFSAGLASFPWDGSDAEMLLRVADQRALESKRRGKNHVTLGPGVHFTTSEACASPDPGDV